MEQELQITEQTPPKKVKTLQKAVMFLAIVRAIFSIFPIPLPLPIPIPTIITIALWCCLLFIASNKPTKIATILLLVANFIPFIGALVSAFAVGIIFKANKEMDPNSKSWFVTYIAIHTITAGLLLSSLVNPQTLFYYTSSINTLWTIASQVILAATFFGIAKCSAYSGDDNYYNGAEKVYSPINKYVLGTIIGTIVYVGLMFIINLISADIDNLLNF